MQGGDGTNSRIFAILIPAIPVRTKLNLSGGDGEGRLRKEGSLRENCTAGFPQDGSSLLLIGICVNQKIKGRLHENI